MGVKVGLGTVRHRAMGVKAGLGAVRHRAVGIKSATSRIEEHMNLPGTKTCV